MKRIRRSKPPKWLFSQSSPPMEIKAEQKKCDEQNRDQEAFDEGRGSGTAQESFFGQVGFGGRGHAVGPNVETGPVAIQAPELTDCPRAPDALAFVDAGVGNLVLAEVLLGPAADAVFAIVGPRKGKVTDAVRSFRFQLAIAKDQVESHLMPPGEHALPKEAGPGAAGKARVGFARL